MKFGTHAGKAAPVPDGAVRQSQVVSTFGPGAMLDLLSDAVLVGGLDFWSYVHGTAVAIAEPRLRDSIAERFKQLGQELSREQPFLAPPRGNDREATKLSGVGVLEFPQWFSCQNPKCRALMRAKDGLDLKNHRYQHNCDRDKHAECVPVRFVAACKRGHIDDFPWIYLAHQSTGNACSSPSLEFHEGTSGDFNDIEIRCACGAKSKLSAANGLQISCNGNRPWLGREGKQECDENIRLLVRTASNSYFPQVVSALSIPNPAAALFESVDRVWDVLKNAAPETLPAFRTIAKVRLEIEGYSDDEVMRVVRARLDDKPLPQEPLRTAEFRQFVSQKREVAGELPTEDDAFFAREAKTKEPLADGIERVVLATKLREVLAQVGFTRLEPVSADLQGEYDLGVKTAQLGLTTNWLPATELRGEGVFVQLSEASVQAWEKRDAVKARAQALASGYDDWLATLGKEARESAPPFPGVRFYMLHSLSHLLMSAISLECGYAASALRERIYCGPSARDQTPMAAILLSTGTAGTEGTLGGLVEQGRALREHLRSAFDMGRLCSNDPVCAGHSPAKDNAERFLEGAACHGCLFVAECSCERFNRYLDRALVVPTLGHPAELAFFSTKP